MTLYTMKIIYDDGHSFETCIDLKAPMTVDKLISAQRQEPGIKECFLLRTDNTTPPRLIIPKTTWRFAK